MSIDNFQTCLSKANAVPQYIIWETYSPCSSKSETCSPKCLKVCIANIGLRIVFAVEKNLSWDHKSGKFCFMNWFPSFISKWYESFWYESTLTKWDIHWKKSHSEKRKILRKIDWQPNLSKEYYFFFSLFRQWSESRVSFVRHFFSHLLCFFPHEKNQKDIFRKWQKDFWKLIVFIKT